MTLFQTHPYVILVNVGFGLLCVFHLVYLGVMFDNSGSEEEVCTWRYLFFHLIDIDTQWWLAKQAGNTILYYPFARFHCAWPWYFSISPAQQLCIPCEPHFRFMILSFGWFLAIYCFYVRLALLSKMIYCGWQQIFPSLTVDKANLKIIIVFILINSMCVTIHFVKFVFISSRSNDKIVIPCLFMGYGFVPTLNQSYHIRPTASCDTTDSG